MAVSVLLFVCNSELGAAEAGRMALRNCRLGPMANACKLTAAGVVVQVQWQL